MRKYITTRSELTGVADAIRDLAGTDQPLSYPFGFVDAINTVEAWPYGECQDIIGSVVSTTGLASRTTLASNTFRANTSITFVSFPLVSTMSYTAFSGCTNLKAVRFETLTTIPDRAFTGCTALEYAEFPACTSISALGSTSTASTSHPFYSCSNLYLSIPAYSETFSSYAFSGIEIRGITAGCLSIGELAFARHSSLNTANFPSCTVVDTDAFAYCSSLTTVSLPVCTSVYSYAFFNCLSLKTASFPACVFIASAAFYGNRALTTVDLLVCSRIYSGAFATCYSLATVKLPACSYLSTQVFSSCSALMSVYLLASSVAALTSSYCFYNTPMVNSTYTGTYGSIYVPASLLTAYQSATNWATFSSRFVGLTDEEIAAL